MPRLCGPLYRKLLDFIGLEGWVKSYPPEPEVQFARECTIDVVKPQVAKRLGELGKAAWVMSYGAGSIAIMDNNIYAGDTVTLLENKEKKVKELEEAGCKVEYVHEHKEFGVAHIHINCPNVVEVTKIARILSEES
jgi:hypothetical protein